MTPEKISPFPTDSTVDGVVCWGIMKAKNGSFPFSKDHRRKRYNLNPTETLPYEGAVDMYWPSFYKSFGEPLQIIAKWTADKLLCPIEKLTFALHTSRDFVEYSSITPERRIFSRRTELLRYKLDMALIAPLIIKVKGLGFVRVTWSQDLSLPGMLVLDYKAELVKKQCAQPA